MSAIGLLRACGATAGSRRFRRRMAGRLAALLCMLGTSLSCYAEVAPEFFGMHIHRAHSVTPWPLFRFDSWRLWDASVGWRAMEREPGKWNFEILDRLVELAERRGVELVLTLGMTPRWAASRPDEDFVYGKGGRSPPRDFRDWERYVRKVAERYRGRIRYYELWNEPTFTEIDRSKGYFHGSVREMVELARIAHEVLKSIDAENKLLTPGFTDDGNRLMLFLDSGGKRYVDIVSQHVYAKHPEHMYARLQKLTTLLKRKGYGHLPLWNTECGYARLEPDENVDYGGARDADQHAAFVVRSLVLAAGAGVQRFFWYSLDHDEMGLIRMRTRYPNLSGRAYLRARRWLTGADVSGCVRGGDAVWRCGLSRDGRQAWLVWRPRGAIAWQIPEALNAVRIESFDATADDVAPGMRLSVGEMPVLLVGDTLAW